MNSSLVLIGAGGHALVCAELAQLCGFVIAGLVVNEQAPVKPALRAWSILGDDHAVLTGDTTMYAGAINGIGFVPRHTIRHQLYLQYKNAGFRFPVLVHDTAVVSPSAILSDGVQVFARSVIQADAWVGENCIINTGVIVEHECRIGADVHLAPGAVVCGDVELGEGVFVGANATLLPGVRLAAGEIIPAGQVVRP